MPATRTETVTARDGGEFAATLVLPETGEGPGIMLLQEIFGVNDFLLDKAGSLAALGYVVLCPDVFWRIQPGVSLAHDGDGLQQGFGLVTRYSTELEQETKTADLVASLEHLKALPEVVGKTAVMGYCLGGLLAYLSAAAGQPDACVSYYGSGIADLLEFGPQITCPILLHFGGSDPYISNEQIEAVREAFASREDVRFVVQPEAGHAFEN
ncbi:MAG: dienelactone hydrolase family protein, partial [Acidimicrobiales bacterium]